MTEDLVSVQTRRGISWNLLAAVIVNLTRILVLSTLGRNLSKADFGVVAAAVTINAVVFSVRDLGMGQALIQRRETQPKHFTTAFAVSIMIGTVAMAIVLIAAPFIAESYHMPELEDVVRALAPLFFVGGLSMVSRARCRRYLKFRTIAVIDTVAFVAGAATSITLALLGWGPWSLVAGYLVEEFIGSCAYMVVERPPVSFRIDRVCFFELIGFGGWQIANSIAGNLAVNVDNVVVGRSLGPTALGYYARAYDLMKLPSQVFAAIVGNVLFSSFARIQDDQPRVAKAFRRGLLVNALVLLPASAVFIASAPEIIRILFGPNWSGLVLSFRVLTVTMMFRTSHKLAILVVVASGRVDRIALMNVVYLIAAAFVSSVTVKWGIAAVAVSTSAVIVCMMIVTTSLAKNISGISWASIVRAHLPGVAAALSVGLVCWPLGEFIRQHSLGPVAIVAILGAVALMMTAIAVIFTRSLFGEDWDWLRQQFFRNKKVS